MGLKSVFLSARPIVLSLARSTMPSSTTLFSNKRKVQRARPLGGLEQAKAISLASFSPSKNPTTARRRPRLAPKTGPEPFFPQLFGPPENHEGPGFRGLVIPVSLHPFAAFQNTGFN